MKHGRLIDADALIADIKECIEVKYSNYKYEQLEGLEVALSCVDEQPTITQNPDEWCTDCKEYDSEKHSCPRFNHVIRKTLEQRWIPCSERLPQPNEEDADGFIKAYLVQDGRWMDVARWNGDCWIAWGYGTALTNVIAWMPLPEPYRKDGD